ncbi:mannose-6-phosphate isomerase, class I [Calditrichota bacterium LG25]
MKLEFVARPYELINKIQNYSWGTRNEQAFIPRLLNMAVEPDRPYAELWMGTHPSAPSEVVVDGHQILLGEFIRQFPQQILGTRVIERFGVQLPFLFKVLSAGEALSIQAHPNKQQAEVLHQRDPEHYPDDNHKPEIAIALDELTALVGFRSLKEIDAVLRTFPEILEFTGPLEFSFVSARDEEQENRQKFRQFYQTLMLKSQTHTTEMETALNKIEQKLLQKKKRDERDEWFLKLKKKYGADVGLFSIYLLNLLHLKKGQGVFLKAGVPHAYLKGNIVECMANSDNVVRAGLTPKFKDVKTLIEILTYETGPVEIYEGGQNEKYVYKTPVDEFSITHVNLDEKSNVSFFSETVSIMMVVNGQGEIVFNKGRLAIKKGQSILLPAGIASFELVSDGSLEIFSAYVP